MTLRMRIYSTEPDRGHAWLLGLAASIEPRILWTRCTPRIGGARRPSIDAVLTEEEARLVVPILRQVGGVVILGQDSTTRSWLEVNK